MADSDLAIGDTAELKKLVAGHPDIPEHIKVQAERVHGASELARLILAAIPHLTGATSDPAVAESLLQRLGNSLTVESHLHLKTIHEDGKETDHGIVARNKSDLITTAGVNFLVGILTGTNATATAISYHALGTGTTAAAVGDTALQTELASTNYTGGVRATGSHVVGASNNIYQSVGTNTIPGGGTAQAITELGLMTQAALAGGTLFDHFVFAAVNLNPGDSLQSTVNITFSAGG